MTLSEKSTELMDGQTDGQTDGLTVRQTDRLTDNGDYIRPSVERSPQIF